jgi:hypothetical protein
VSKKENGKSFDPPSKEESKYPSLNGGEEDFLVANWEVY